jgi:hypothetical protein
MSWRAVHITKNTDTKITHLTNLLCKGFLRLNHLSSVEKYNPNMNTLKSLAPQVFNTWYSKATIIQKNTQRFSVINVTLHTATPHTTWISQLDFKKTHLKIMHYMLNNLNICGWIQVVTHSTTIQAGSISSQAGSKYLMSKNVCIFSDKGVFIHASLPSHKKFVQCSFDQ